MPSPLNKEHSMCVFWFSISIRWLFMATRASAIYEMVFSYSPINNHFVCWIYLVWFSNIVWRTRIENEYIAMHCISLLVLQFCSFYHIFFTQFLRCLLHIYTFRLCAANIHKHNKNRIYLLPESMSVQTTILRCNVNNDTTPNLLT